MQFKLWQPDFAGKTGRPTRRDWQRGEDHVGRRRLEQIQFIFKDDLA